MASLPKFDYLCADGGVFKYKDSYGTLSIFLLFEHKSQLYEHKISFLCSVISFLIPAANTMKMSGLYFESHFLGKWPLSVCVSLFFCVPTGKVLKSFVFLGSSTFSILFG